MAKIKDDRYEIIENDIEKIQMKPSQYIGALGTDASMHLSKECINNAWDEVINPLAVGKEVTITLDEKTGMLTVTDNSRGIPFDILKEVLTIIASSTKFNRDSGGTAGENGTGMKAITALSTKMEVTVTREGKKGRIVFEEGVLKKPLKIVDIDDENAHGTTFKFIPSKIFLGDDARIIPEELKTWVEKIIYLLPKDVKTQLSINYIEKENSFRKTYKNKNGLYDYCKVLAVEKPMLDPIHASKLMSLTELVTNRRNNHRGMLGEKIETERTLAVEYAFTYVDGKQDMISDSFCNMVNTFDNGIHFDAIKSAIATFLATETNKTITKRDSAELTILPRDIEPGLVITCSLVTNINPQFISQIKSKVGNSELFNPVKRLTMNSLEEYFAVHPKELKKLCDIVKTNARARLAGTKARNSVLKEDKTDLSRYKIKNLKLCNNLSRGAYREIFLTEGESASSSTARYNNDFQSIFSFRGFPANTFTEEVHKILENSEIKGLVAALETNIGPRFDINKCMYDKIILTTDSDSDGYGIRSLLSAFFLKHMPKLVEDGRLYYVTAPLFKLKNGEFIMSKKEYVEAFDRNIERLYSIRVNGKTLSKSETLELLARNRNYLETLTSLSNQYSVHRDIIEFIAFNHNNKNISKLLKSKFKELSISDNILVGVYKERYQMLVIDEVFAKSIKPLIKYSDINNDNLNYEVIEKKTNNSKGNLTLGEMMFLFEGQKLPIAQRYKGLGELNSNDLKETTMNPNKRILVRLTIADLEKELERFEMYHGATNPERKETFGFVYLDKEYLDN